MNAFCKFFEKGKDLEVQKTIKEDLHLLFLFLERKDIYDVSLIFKVLEILPQIYLVGGKNEILQDLNQIFNWTFMVPDDQMQHKLLQIFLDLSEDKECKTQFLTHPNLSPTLEKLSESPMKEETLQMCIKIKEKLQSL